MDLVSRTEEIHKNYMRILERIVSLLKIIKIMFEVAQKGRSRKENWK